MDAIIAARNVSLGISLSAWRSGNFFKKLKALNTLKNLNWIIWIIWIKGIIWIKSLNWLNMLNSFNLLNSLNSRISVQIEVLWETHGPRTSFPNPWDIAFPTASSRD